MKKYPRLTSLCFFFGILLLYAGVMLGFCCRGSTPVMTEPRFEYDNARTELGDIK